MNVESFIYEAIFAEKEKYRCFFELIWDNFKEDGFVITDEEGYETDAVLKAIALQNLLGEFVYRMYDATNEIGFEDLYECLRKLEISNEDFINYCRKIKNMTVDEKDFEAALKNALDRTTEEVADKLLEMFSPDDLFDYMFTVTYDFEQDFTFEFEDYEEMQAFVETNQDRLDSYKEEYSNVVSWIEAGMAC